MSVLTLTAANFDDAIAKHDLLVIDFWAQWCGPCKTFGKIMEEAAGHYPDVVFAKVNVEDEKTLAEEFAVQSIPFIMIIKNRTVVYAESGMLSMAALQELLEQAKNIQA